ncbi:hypothetical protein JOD57_003883 [Geodermatophilus bullaregiensis]|uniref:hypothetical protein n=1 Tax=Geodermatophilus bullaregiensis TaxID=1564160 RepID=UPI001958A5CB|nr:hypothetical protein [Geodermatophilus bullaregiensis]MBM7808046.1 hypothetical protein [Geodermatophilus bullaregiensis]
MGHSTVRHVSAREPTGAPSHVYYFEIGAGTWRGTFSFRVTDWRGLLRSGIGVRNLVLVAAMALTQRLTGRARLRSVIMPRPEEGPFGTALNRVRLSRLGITLYDLDERYELAPDGTGVSVHAAERFGPIPRILTRSFTYPALIRNGGMSSTYYMPLLGAPWTATYDVSADRRALSGTLTSAWAIATEDAVRVGDRIRRLSR